MAAPVYYNYLQSSAPAVYNVAGAVIAILDACLVNGYTGKTAAGWTKVYSGTNLAVYRAPSGSERCYLRVDDTNANYTLFTAYDSMSAVSTGTGPFPDGTRSGSFTSYFLPKATSTGTSTLTGSNYLPWSVFADDKIFYMRVQAFSSVPGDLTESSLNGASAGSGGRFMVFGEYVPAMTGYRHSVLGAVQGTPNTTMNGTTGWDSALGTTRSSANIVGTGVTFATTQQVALNGMFGSGLSSSHRLASPKFSGRAGGFRSPNIAGTIQMSRISLQAETAAENIAGFLPGIWQFTDNWNTGSPSSSPYRTNDTFSGDSASIYAGKSWIIKEQSQVGSNNYGIIAFETSDTWYI